MEVAFDEQRQRELRARIARLVTSVEPDPPTSPVDVVISHVEVCESHGTGVLTKRLFGRGRGIVSVRSQDHYGATQDFGDRAFRLSHEVPAKGARLASVLSAFHGHDVRRILCVPYYADDVATGLALKDIYGAPLCTYIMDDNNVEERQIPDDLLRDLLARSELRLAISAEIRDAYERKFGGRFWVVPPLVPPDLIQVGPARPAEDLDLARGAIVGNIWGAEWVEALRTTVRGSGIELDWYRNAGARWLAATENELAEDGIHLRGGLPEIDLTPILRRTPYVVLPSGTLDERDSRRAIARLSLPSKIPYVFASSRTPILVLGHPDTAAARFVTSQGIGLSVPYDRERFVDAVREIADPAVQAAMRGRAAALAPAFSAEGGGDWIWRSLEAGRALDNRWERLFPRCVERTAA